MTACRKPGLSPDLGNNEDVVGPLQKLPGCNKITETEEEAIAQANAECSTEDAPPAVLARQKRIRRARCAASTRPVCNKAEAFFRASRLH